MQNADKNMNKEHRGYHIKLRLSKVFVNFLANPDEITFWNGCIQYRNIILKFLKK